MWAETHAGEDQPIDLMEWKLLEQWRDHFRSNVDYYSEQADKMQARMDELEAGFKVSDEEF